MIRQPDFLTAELFERFKTETLKKKPELNIDKAMFEDIYEGICMQMMHKGSYDDEPKSFKNYAGILRGQWICKVGFNTQRNIYKRPEKKQKKHKEKQY